MSEPSQRGIVSESSSKLTHSPTSLFGIGQAIGSSGCSPLSVENMHRTANTDSQTSSALSDPGLFDSLLAVIYSFFTALSTKFTV